MKKIAWVINIDNLYDLRNESLRESLYVSIADGVDKISKFPNVENFQISFVTNEGDAEECKTFVKDFMAFFKEKENPKVQFGFLQGIGEKNSINFDSKTELKQRGSKDRVIAIQNMGDFDILLLEENKNIREHLLERYFFETKCTNSSLIFMMLANSKPWTTERVEVLWHGDHMKKAYFNETSCLAAIDRCITEIAENGQKTHAFSENERD